MILLVCFMSATIMDKDQIYVFWQLIYLIDFKYVGADIHRHYFLRKAALNLHFVLIEEVKTIKIC